jgi:endoglycosylceramidase
VQMGMRMPRDANAAECGHARRPLRRIAALAVIAGMLLASCVPNGSPPPVSDPGSSEELMWLTAVRGERAGIYDTAGRQMLLRGVNFNHLGDYFQSHPDLPTVATLDEADWEDAAAQGMNVIRLVTNWSAWEPERGQLDPDYLARVRRAVEDANRHGMYVVIDMHQDAWSKHVFTPADEVCAPGTRPQIGWDGAPEWATFTDGWPTCTSSSREESPAVRAAWDAFYRNRSGVRDALADLWGRIATEFAHDPGVAGFDLLNEPGYGFDQDITLVSLAQFYRSAISRIRSAEAAAGGRGHIVFFETTVNGPFVATEFSDDPNLVFAPHNYGESIGPDIPGLLDVIAAALQTLARAYGTTTWIGEYGSFAGDDAVRSAYMARFNRLDDQNPGAGGAWWQWEQECGDPHDVAYAYPPGEEWVANQRARCGTDARMNTPCTARSYPRATPGRMVSLTAEPCGGAVTVRGRTPTPSTAELWFVSDSDVPPTVTGVNLGTHFAEQRRGGWRITVAVQGDYRIEVTGS